MSEMIFDGAPVVVPDIDTAALRAFYRWPDDSTSKIKALCDALDDARQVSAALRAERDRFEDLLRETEREYNRDVTEANRAALKAERERDQWKARTETNRRDADNMAWSRDRECEAKHALRARLGRATEYADTLLRADPREKMRATDAGRELKTILEEGTDG